jgi:hypothetical protein
LTFPPNGISSQKKEERVTGVLATALAAKGAAAGAALFIWLIALAIGIVIIVWGWKVAKRKGYSPWIGFALTFFLSWIGLIIVYVLPDKRS